MICCHVLAVSRSAGFRDRQHHRDPARRARAVVRRRPAAALDVIARNADRLSVMAGDLLDLAGLESGDLPMTVGAMDLAAVIGQAVQSAAAAAAAKQLTMTRCTCGRSKGNLTGRSPVDRGKPGSKIHAVSDRNGLPLHVDISAANLNDHRLLPDMVDGIAPV